MTLGDRIKESRIKKDMTQEELGSKIGVKKQAIYKYEQGIVVNLKRDVIGKLASALDVSPSYLLGYNDNQDVASAPKKDFDIFSIPGIMRLPKMVQKPLIGTIACGTPILAEQNIDSYIAVPEDIHCDFALRCEGDSMIGAHIMPGASVYIREQPDVENGEIAAVIVDDDHATLKRVYKTDTTMTLMAENSKYQPIVITGEDLSHVRILGRAVAFTNYLL